MSETIEVILDNENHVVIPSSLQTQLGLNAGMTLVVEKNDSDQLYLRILPAPSEELPVLVNKGGVTVVKAEPLDALRDFVHNERNRRIETLLEPTNL